VNATDQAHGICLISSRHTTFNEGTDVAHVSGNRTYGINVTSSDDILFGTTAVSFITAASDAYGISLQDSDSAAFSSNHSISYLNATDRALGIFLSGSDDNAFYNCTISNLTAGNETYGVYVADASTNNTISDGEIRDNNHGIRVENSDNNRIQKNMIVNNTGGATGVNVTDGSDGNTMEGNCFIDNIPQARDDGSKNVWNGNYWSDYTGPGPYTIAGAANSKDDNPSDECPPIAPRVPVGGEAYPESKASVLAPWIAIGVAIIAGATIFVRRRGAQS